MKPSSLLISLFFFATTAAAAGPSDIYEDRANGFRLVKPEFGRHDAYGITLQSVIFNGPVVEGSNASCNVQIQNMDVGPEQFVELSTNQFAMLGLKTEKQESRKVSGRDAILWRFSNEKITTISLAVFVPKKVLVVACQASCGDFDEYAGVFQKVIDSFEVTQP